MPKTNFRPETHGFAFGNRWEHDQEETDEVRKLPRDGIYATRTFLSLIPGGPLLWFALRDITRRLNSWIEGALVEPYGLCGGMAFAALDYYHAGLAVPRGKEKGQPTQASSEGRVLRDYIWRRLIDSLVLNTATFLTWMAILHLISDRGPFRGGPGWLCKQSEKQWKALKKHIDAGRPWPIGLVGTTTNPTLNHQVVAYDYEDSGDGTGTIFVYDMNCPEEDPDKQPTIEVDFRGQTLEASEDCANSQRGPLQGFFCETYMSKPNPPRIRWP